MVSTHLKHISQIGSSPQVGLNIKKKLSCHHLALLFRGLFLNQLKRAVKHHRQRSPDLNGRSFVEVGIDAIIDTTDLVVQGWLRVFWLRKTYAEISCDM